MRIFPSWSTLMKLKVGSTLVFTTVRFRPYLSAIGSQYPTQAPPSGSAPSFSPESGSASRSMVFSRSAM